MEDQDCGGLLFVLMDIESQIAEERMPNGLEQLEDVDLRARRQTYLEVEMPWSVILCMKTVSSWTFS